MDTNLIIYDGECGFCNKTLLYLAKIDTNNNFLFVSNLSKKGKQILLENNLVEVSKDSIVVFNNGQIFTKGKAVKIIAQNVDINALLRKIIDVTHVVVLDFGYTIIANHRLSLTNNSCKIPSKEILSKFILS
jgi:predicted DCC family thiol-disulfide oxidoreductase YuxK